MLPFLSAGWTKQCGHLLITVFCLQAGRSSVDIYWWLFLFADLTKQCGHLLMTVFVCRLDEAVQTFIDDPVFVCRLDEAVQTFIDDCFCLQAGQSMHVDIYWWLILFAGWTKQCRHLLVTVLFAGWMKQWGDVFVCRLDKAVQTFIDECFCLQAGQSSADIYWWLFCLQAGWSSEEMFLFAGWTKQCRHLLMTVFVCRLDGAVWTFIVDCFCLQAGWSSADVYWWPCFCLQAGWSNADIYWWLFLFADWTKQCTRLLMTLFLFAGSMKQCRHLLMTLNQTLSWTLGLTCEKFITAFENYGWGDKGVQLMIAETAVGNPVQIWFDLFKP